LRAESLPKASFPGGRLWGFAMRASERGDVGEGFDPDAKRGEVEIVCEMWGGGLGKSLREAWLSLSPFFFSFFFLFLIKSLLCLKLQKSHAALAMEIKNL